jgi:hypothetical protein
VSTNRIITLIWLAVFVAIAAADLVHPYLPAVPHRMSVLLTIGALFGAFKFTMTYSRRTKHNSPTRIHIFRSVYRPVGLGESPDIRFVPRSAAFVLKCQMIDTHYIGPRLAEQCSQLVVL